MAPSARYRRVEGVVIAFFDSGVLDFTHWYEALAEPGVHTAMLLGTSRVETSPGRRRQTVEVIRKLRVIAVTDDPANLGLLSIFTYLGVGLSVFSWDQLEDAARSAARRPELVAPILEAALALRGPS